LLLIDNAWKSAPAWTVSAKIDCFVIPLCSSCHDSM